MIGQKAEPESNPNCLQRLIKCICSPVNMEDVSLFESLIACWYGESEPQKSNSRQKDLEGLKNIFAPNDIGVEKPSVECKGPSAKSLGENKIIDI